MSAIHPTAYLTLARFSGEPDLLLDHYLEAAEVMAGVGRDHGLILHAVARTNEGLLIANLWPSRNDSEAAARDPRRLGQITRFGITPDQISREHHDVASYMLGSPEPSAH